MTQWRLWVQLRDYIVRTTRALAAFQRDLPQVLKSIQGSLQAGTEANPKPEVNKFESDNENKKEITLKPVDMNTENLSELQRALKTVNTYIPLYFSQVRLNFSKNEDPKGSQKNIPKWKVKKNVISKATIDARTRFLVSGLGDHLTEGGRLRKLEELCNHLRQHPQTKGVAVKRGSIQRLLRILEKTNDRFVECEAREALALLGYISPVKAHGVRLLTIDGGGVRGLVALEVLRKIEEKAGQPIHKLFDYICGVSTGAILAVMMGVHRFPLDKCETLYRELSTQIFTQTALKGATGLVMHNSFYNSTSWTEILKEHMGDKSLIETARDTCSPKICLVATSANTNRIQAYLFRNYNLPYRVTSHYQGTSSPLLWEAVRASAAAPGYFSEFRIGDLILLDGGLFVNNPTAIAVHEAKKLWPDVDLQCVVSVGTGRHEPIANTSETSISWATRIRTVLNSATDTEGVHTTMHDLLPFNVYYRFNPYLSDEIGLDEIGTERLELMMEDTRLYLRKNEKKFEEAARTLSKVKNPIDRIKDWYKYQLRIWPSD